ncbi:MAG: alpha/beta hydrolase [Gammaproteobacteria bacterium]|nr:alpha/beta hydrolase [Gammaproteobacteria bacterium]
MPRFAIPAVLVCMLQILQGCATPHVQSSAAGPTTPVLEASFAVMDDGFRLPLKLWPVNTKSRVILLALHGLNDYHNGFTSTGEYLARRGITTFAYDQRGFGNSEGRGLWHGSGRMVEDLLSMIRLLRRQYPDQPLYLIGESMGGAVVLAALRDAPLAVDGLILLAPAIWSRDRMPWYQRFALWLAARTMPSLKLTGDGLDLQPTDNLEMWRAWSRDPLVIKSTRVDVLYGTSNLMDRAVAAAANLHGRVLILYGRRDEIVPREPTCQWLGSLPSENGHLRQTRIYANGYHMLTRDLQADVVLEDIAKWIAGADHLTDGSNTIALDAFCPAALLSPASRARDQ